VPAGHAGMRGQVRETSFAARIEPLQTSSVVAEIPWQNKDFAAHKYFQPEVGKLFDIKESFPI
jgi:hypothetical protein